MHGSGVAIAQSQHRKQFSNDIEMKGEAYPYREFFSFKAIFRVILRVLTVILCDKVIAEVIML